MFHPPHILDRSERKAVAASIKLKLPSAAVNVPRILIKNSPSSATANVVYQTERLVFNTLAVILFTKSFVLLLQATLILKQQY